MCLLVCLLVRLCCLVVVVVLVVVVFRRFRSVLLLFFGLCRAWFLGNYLVVTVFKFFCALVVA